MRQQGHAVLLVPVHLLTGSFPLTVTQNILNKEPDATQINCLISKLLLVLLLCLQAPSDKGFPIAQE